MSTRSITVKTILALIPLVGLLVYSSLASSVNPVRAEHARPDPWTSGIEKSLYLPVIKKGHPRITLFGVEALTSLKLDSYYLQKTQELGASIVRLNQRVSWRELQPAETSPIEWEKLQDFETELNSGRSIYARPLVIVNDSPYWATILPSSCAPIRSDKFAAFAAFMVQMVTRYSQPAYNVHDWELGNEPDIDVNLAERDSAYGCWGDVSDPYYGGEHYGEMLKVVAPAIRSADPKAKIWIGGLLLDAPETLITSRGRPELFLKGILEAGAADYFDIVPYHWYTVYWDQNADYDFSIPSWNEWGGGVIGKAAFLRQIMAEYGVHKTIAINEFGLGCPDDSNTLAWCNPPTEGFEQAKADLLVKGFTRGASINLGGFLWYSLEAPGWRNTGLTNIDTGSKPAFFAYKELIARIGTATYLGSADYGENIEAYAFQQGADRVYILWSKVDQTVQLSVTTGGLAEVHSRDGEQIGFDAGSGTALIPVGFSPVYLIYR